MQMQWIKSYKKFLESLKFDLSIVNIDINESLGIWYSALLDAVGAEEVDIFDTLKLPKDDYLNKLDLEYLSDNIEFINSLSSIGLKKSHVESSDDLETFLNKSCRFMLIYNIEEELEVESKPIIESIANVLKAHFIINGSYVAKLVSDTLPQIGNLPPANLLANDIDVYHGEFGSGDTMLSKGKEHNKHLQVDGVDREVNFVHCTELNTQSLLNTCDINAVQASIFVHVQPSGAVKRCKLTVGPALWHFLLRDRTLQAISFKTPAQTFVRLAYKAFQHQHLKVDYKILTLTGEVYASHQRKVAEMTGWKSSPFDEYMLVSKPNHSFEFQSRNPSPATNTGSPAVIILAATINTPKQPSKRKALASPSASSKTANTTKTRTPLAPLKNSTANARPSRKSAKRCKVMG